MKAADVRIGGEYLTRIAGELVRVRVTGTRQVPHGPICADGKKTTRTAFEIERVDLSPERPTKRRLNPRSAAALRPAACRRCKGTGLFYVHVLSTAGGSYFRQEVCSCRPGMSALCEASEAAS